MSKALHLGPCFCYQLTVAFLLLVQHLSLSFALLHLSSALLEAFCSFSHIFSDIEESSDTIIYMRQLKTPVRDRCFKINILELYM